jgi:hypothetical protein
MALRQKPKLAEEEFYGANCDVSRVRCATRDALQFIEAARFLIKRCLNILRFIGEARRGL